MSNDNELIDSLLEYSFSGKLKESKIVKDAIRKIQESIDELLGEHEGVLSYHLMKDIYDICSIIYNNRVQEINRGLENRLVIEAVAIRLLAARPCGLASFIDIEQFKAKYLEFNDLSEEEVEKLLRFRNYLSVAVQLIKPKNHRTHLLDLITRIAEGKDAHYVTGGGASKQTLRRCFIILTEGNLSINPRPPRIKRNTDEETIAESSISEEVAKMSKKAKQSKTTTEEKINTNKVTLSTTIASVEESNKDEVNTKTYSGSVQIDEFIRDFDVIDHHEYLFAGRLQEMQEANQLDISIHEIDPLCVFENIDL